MQLSSDKNLFLIILLNYTNQQDMKFKNLTFVALVIILLSTFYTQQEAPYRYFDGILKIFRDQKGVPRIVADSK